jgi:ABC-type polysaccharide/polyol phosphate transport system ATPase subunit
MGVEPAIVVDGVSKKFRIHKERADSLKERITSKRRANHEDFWALKDVSLVVPKGSVYGLVGHNGSGKSSLLRIMANIHRPTTGTVTTHGRISALLELGAGFHPDLTGRENIYLNAAILGLSKAETDGLYDKIVEFSGLREFIDTPVKHFSSGMYVRLGFSVAVHVEPQILLVDEVIAVGDEEFQRRCFEHLNKLRRKGVTIVIVTHGLGFVQTLCDEATWLDHGVMKAQGKASEVVQEYLGKVNRDEVVRIEHEVAEGRDWSVPKGTTASIEAFELLDDDGEHLAVGTSMEPITFRLRWKANEPIEAPLLSFAIKTESGTPLANPTMFVSDEPSVPVYLGEGYADYRIDQLLLAPGTYFVNAAIHDCHAMTVFDRVDDIVTLRVQPGGKIVRGMVEMGGGWGPLVGSETDRSPVEGTGVPELGGTPEPPA